MEGAFIETTASYKAPFPTRKAVLEGYKKSLDGSGVQLEYYSVLSNLKYPGPQWIKRIPGLKFVKDDKSYDGAGCTVNGNIKADTLLQVMDKTFADIKSPLFAVVSNNSAHHFSYVLSNIAFRRFGSKGKRRAVINFDMHWDFGATKYTKPWEPNAMIDCGRWGQFHLFHTYKDGKRGDYYMVLGTNERPRVYGNYRIDIRHDAKTYGTNKFQAADIIKQVKKFNQLQCDVYISVDRDFMVGNGSKYAGLVEELYDADSGRELVKNCVEALGEANIVGFDVTGLPAKSRNNSPGVNQEGAKDFFSQAIEDIEMFYQIMQTRI